MPWITQLKIPQSAGFCRFPKGIPCLVIRITARPFHVGIVCFLFVILLFFYRFHSYYQYFTINPRKILDLREILVYNYEIYEGIMELISWQFILFFLLTMALLYSRLRNKKIVLFILNVIFYMFAGVVATLVLFLFAVITFFGAKLIQDKPKKKLIFTIFLLIALLPLFTYKYMAFFINIVFHISLVEFHLFAPLGISFFTFQGIGYLIDVYRGECEAECNFLNYFTFLSLFTCVSSGPINRSQSLLQQIKNYNETEFDYDKTVKGFRYVLLGLFMKIFISACVSCVAPSANSGIALLIDSFCFTIQIYCDFCGYSYIAYGLSSVIGIDVIQNFDKPYTSKSLTEFWRRWHISLSSWFRDYLYISLGGSRCTKWRVYLNIFVVFTVSGLWHGANWTFLVWGMLNGLFLVFEKITGFYKKSSKKGVNLLKQGVTLLLINTLWIFFDAKSLSDAIHTIVTIFTQTPMDFIRLFSVRGMSKFIVSLGLNLKSFLLLIGACVAFIVLEILARKKEIVNIFDSKCKVLEYGKYILMILVILFFGVTGSVGEFIYANF